MNFRNRFFSVLPAFFILLLLSAELAWGRGAYSYRFPDPKASLDAKADTVIGLMGEYVTHKKDTLLDIARDNNLGFNELECLYPDIDPWIPPEGTRLLIPTQWILPETAKFGLVINIAEMRLFFFNKSIQMVRTYPIGIGDEGWFSPLGTFYVAQKRKNPAWHIPESLQEKYQMKIMPAGPDNPLGDYWLGLSIPGYGIHGTNFPWAIGRLVTHGCIRLYPEDIERLFAAVPLKTPVEMIYEPVKIGFKQGRIFAEVHPDIYSRIPDLTAYGHGKVQKHKWADRIDLDLFTQVLQEAKGIPVDITRN
ncbi:MAG: L,D-transpeptidase family protein [Deltaproteobacteria bacterium]|nr:L,D-transpeptidase family protein [Deltaproteobacteria bacterium]